MATIKIIVRKEKDKIRVNSKGETTIFIQYGHQGKTILFSTSIRVNPQYLKWAKDDQGNDKDDLDQYNTPLKLNH
ncbi:MAG: hypothetical protein K2X86_05735 [Cytophagaceae bacterium]|nr:hypothetical protein [Cytophagaceae bacterium]